MAASDIDGGGGGRAGGRRGGGGCSDGRGCVLRHQLQVAQVVPGDSVTDPFFSGSGSRLLSDMWESIISLNFPKFPSKYRFE